MTTTYCTRTDITSLIGAPAVLACIDDNQDGNETSDEQQFVTDAIERAANDMNEAFEHQYDVLANLTTNTWCKWCNAYLAAWYLFARRGNAPPGSLMESVANYKEKLIEIRWGREKIPEKSPDFNTLPTVSNPLIELKNDRGPLTIDRQQSTGSDPVDGIKRNVSDQASTDWW